MTPEEWLEYERRSIPAPVPDILPGQEGSWTSSTLGVRDQYPGMMMGGLLSTQPSPTMDADYSNAIFQQQSGLPEMIGILDSRQFERSEYPTAVRTTNYEVPTGVDPNDALAVQLRDVDPELLEPGLIGSYPFAEIATMFPAGRAINAFSRGLGRRLGGMLGSPTTSPGGGVDLGRRAFMSNAAKQALALGTAGAMASTVGKIGRGLKPGVVPGPDRYVMQDLMDKGATNQQLLDEARDYLRGPITHIDGLPVPKSVADDAVDMHRQLQQENLELGTLPTREDVTRELMNMRGLGRTRFTPEEEVPLTSIPESLFEVGDESLVTTEYNPMDYISLVTTPEQEQALAEERALQAATKAGLTGDYLSAAISNPWANMAETISQQQDAQAEAARQAVIAQQMAAEQAARSRQAQRVAEQAVVARNQPDRGLQEAQAEISRVADIITQASKVPVDRGLKRGQKKVAKKSPPKITQPVSRPEARPTYVPNYVWVGGYEGGLVDLNNPGMGDVRGPDMGAGDRLGIELGADAMTRGGGTAPGSGMFGYGDAGGR